MSQNTNCVIFSNNKIKKGYYSPIKDKPTLFLDNYKIVKSLPSKLADLYYKLYDVIPTNKIKCDVYMLKTLESIKPWFKYDNINYYITFNNMRISTCDLHICKYESNKETYNYKKEVHIYLDYDILYTHKNGKITNEEANKLILYINDDPKTGENKDYTTIYVHSGMIIMYNKDNRLVDLYKKIMNTDKDPYILYRVDKGLNFTNKNYYYLRIMQNPQEIQKDIRNEDGYLETMKIIRNKGNYKNINCSKYQIFDITNSKYNDLSDPLKKIYDKYKKADFILSTDVINLKSTFDYD